MLNLGSDNIKRFKWIVRMVLLLFIAGSVGVLVAKEYGWGGKTLPSLSPVSSASVSTATPVISDRVVAYYFHTNVRCVSCKKIEEYAREAIEKGFPTELQDGRLAFEVVNVEEPWNKHFIHEYQLVSKSLVIALMAGDRRVRSKNLDGVWRYLGSHDTFVSYVRAETQAFLSEVRR